MHKRGSRFFVGPEATLANPLVRFVGNLGRLFRALSISDPKAWDRTLWQLAGSQSLSGEIVTESTALTYSAVWNAVTLIAGTIAALPLHLMSRAKDGTNAPADDLKLYRLLHDAPNEYMTAMQFRETLLSHVLTWGNGYAEIVRNVTGSVMELWPIAPDRVTPKMRGGELGYEVRQDRGETLWLPRERVLHVAGLGFDGFVGYSPIAMARKSIGLGMALETFGARYFGQGTHPGVVVSHPTQLSGQAHENLKKSLTDAYSGLGNSHRLLLLEEGMKIEKIGIPPDDSQFLESRQFSVTEIARWFNLPPHKLKDLTRSSFSNIESEQRSFYSDTLLPWLVRLEQAYNQQLLTDGDRGGYGRGRLYFKHNVMGILRADVAARGQFYREMFGIGVMSVNDIRALEDMDPVADGDTRLVPMNMTTLANAGTPQPTAPARALPGGEDDDEPANRNGNGNGVPARRGER